MWMMCSRFLENILFMYVNASIDLQYIFRLRQLMLFPFKTLHFHLHSCKDFTINQYLFLSEATLQVDTLNVTYPPPPPRRFHVFCWHRLMLHLIYGTWNPNSSSSGGFAKRSPLCLLLKCAEDIGCDAEWQWQLVRVTGSVSRTGRALGKKRDLFTALSTDREKRGFCCPESYSKLSLLMLLLPFQAVSLSHTHTHANTHIEAICF